MAQRPENRTQGLEYKPRPNAQKPKRTAGELRPYVWKSGPDVRAHEQYQAWLVHKAQANFRGEKHELPFEDFKAVWDQDNNWDNRGRASTNVCMFRSDPELPWHKDNVSFEQRKTYLARVNSQKRGTKYKTK